MPWYAVAKSDRTFAYVRFMLLLLHHIYSSYIDIHAGHTSQQLPRPAWNLNMVAVRLLPSLNHMASKIWKQSLPRSSSSSSCTRSSHVDGNFQSSQMIVPLWVSYAAALGLLQMILAGQVSGEELLANWVRVHLPIAERPRWRLAQSHTCKLYSNISNYFTLIPCNADDFHAVCCTCARTIVLSIKYPTRPTYKGRV